MRRKKIFISDAGGSGPKRGHAGCKILDLRGLVGFERWWEVDSQCAGGYQRM